MSVAIAEEWRVIVGWPYEVSDQGRVRRLGRKPLAPRPNGKGYMRVTLCRPGERRDHYIHRLVCAAFNGPPPTPEHEVDHDNEERGCNRATNLFWRTVAENRARRAIPHGEGHANARLTEADVRAMRASGESSATLAKRYGVGARHVRDVRRGSNWSHVNG